MERIRLGSSELKVSPIACGTWQAGPLWGDQPDDALIGAMRTAWDVGINTFDTAPTYGEGRAEILLSKVLAALPRDEVIVVDKAYTILRSDGKRVMDLSASSLRTQCEDSLERLKTDYIDLYLLHVHDPAADPVSSTEMLETLKKEGKIRAYGVSNHTVEQLRMALSLGAYSVLQQRYNLLDHEAENDVLPFCIASDIGVMAYSPLAKGILSGKYTGKETFTDSRKNASRFQGEEFQTACDKVLSLQPIADKYGVSISQLVHAATLRHPAVSCVIAGVKTPEQIRETAGSVGCQLTSEDYGDLRDVIGW